MDALVDNVELRVIDLSWNKIGNSKSLGCSNAISKVIDKKMG